MTPETSPKTHLKNLKAALHIATQNFSQINQLKPEELLSLFEDPGDRVDSRDRFQFISTSLLNLNSSLSDARMQLVHLGQYQTIENWISDETKEKTKQLLSPEEEGDEVSEREEGI